MVFSQEPVCSICQLWGPRIQATQVQLIKQFTMSLPNYQPRGMGIMGLNQPPLAIAHPQGVQALVMQLPPWPLGFSFEGSATMLCYSLPP